MDMPPTRGQDGQITTGILSMQYFEGRNQLYTLGLDKRVSYWDMARGQISKQLQAGQEVDVPCMAMSMDGELIVVGDSSGELKVFTAVDCRLVHIETVHSAGISAIAISPDNTLIVTADEIGHMFFWRL